MMFDFIGIRGVNGQKVILFIIDVIIEIRIIIYEEEDSFDYIVVIIYEIVFFFEGFIFGYDVLMYLQIFF